jgi:hypothetical protein
VSLEHDVEGTVIAWYDVQRRSPGLVPRLQDLRHPLPGVQHRPPEEAGQAAEERDCGQHSQDNAEHQAEWDPTWAEDDLRRIGVDLDAAAGGIQHKHGPGDG